jgi:hypothetical protein
MTNNKMCVWVDAGAEVGTRAPVLEKRKPRMKPVQSDQVSVYVCWSVARGWHEYWSSIWKKIAERMFSVFDMESALWFD